MSEKRYPDLFIKAVSHLLRIEGGYVNDPDDAGGETMYGISKRQYPELNIKALTINAAIELYYRDYWVRYRCNDMPPVYACFVFDSVVNHNPKTAIKFLQTALRTEADGILGPRTIAEANRLSDNQEYVSSMLIRLLAYRADFYHDLVVDRPSQEKFIMGWMRRLFMLQHFILSEVM